MRFERVPPAERKRLTSDDAALRTKLPDLARRRRLGLDRSAPDASSHAADIVR
jgi:hypothetical protein